MSEVLVDVRVQHIVTEGVVTYILTLNDNGEQPEHIFTLTPAQLSVLVGVVKNIGGTPYNELKVVF